jgi:hypothetical protein
MFGFEKIFGGREEKHEEVKSESESGQETSQESVSVKYDELSLIDAFSVLAPDHGITQENVLSVVKNADLTNEEIDLVLQAFKTGESLDSDEFDEIRQKVIVALSAMGLKGEGLAE